MSNTSSPLTIIMSANNGSIDEPLAYPVQLKFEPDLATVSPYQEVKFMAEPSLMPYIESDEYSVFLLIGDVATEVTHTGVLREFFTSSTDTTYGTQLAVLQHATGTSVEMHLAKVSVGDDPTSTTGEIIVRVG